MAQGNIIQLLIGRNDQNGYGIFNEQYSKQLKDLVEKSKNLEIYYPLVQSLRFPGALNYEKFMWEIKQKFDFKDRGKSDLSIDFKI